MDFHERKDKVENLVTRTISHLEMDDGCLYHPLLTWLNKKGCLPKNYAFNYSLISNLALRFLDNLDKEEEKYFNSEKIRENLANVESQEF